MHPVIPGRAERRDPGMTASGNRSPVRSNEGDLDHVGAAGRGLRV